jgi:hypothetical protein
MLPGVFAANGAVKTLDYCEVGLQICSRRNNEPRSDLLVCIIEHDTDDRDVGCKGDPMKARFPASAFLARALRGDANHHLVILLKPFSGLNRNVPRRVPSYGNAAQTCQQPARGAMEKRVLGEESSIESDRELGSEAYYAVPVRGMGGPDDDELWQIGKAAAKLPSQESHDKAADTHAESATAPWHGRPESR